MSGFIQDPGILSGFWLEGRYFITVANFFIQKSYTKDTENEIIKAMMTAEDDVIISVVSMRIISESQAG